MLASMLLMGTLAIVACAAPSATQQKHVLFVVAGQFVLVPLTSLQSSHMSSFR